MNSNTLKIIVNGPAKAGKTSIVKRYITGENVEDYNLSVGTEYGVKEIEINGETYKLIIWDLGGKKRFDCLQGTFYLGAKGAAYVFDLTDPNSLKKLSECIQEHKKNNPNFINVPAILLGNKSDLKAKISDEQVDLSLKENPEANISEYFKTSAKTGENVNEAFTYLVKKILEA
jgi:small GTP-binding protein